MSRLKVTSEDVPFWEIFHIAPHLAGQKPQKPQFWGVNRRFQAKLAKSKNGHIIKTTASVPTKFCTLIKTTKCPSWVVPTHALQIQDGGRPLSWKNRKIVISRPQFWHNLARWCSSTLLSDPTAKIWNQKSRMAAAAILKNRKLTYLLRGLSDFDKILHNDAVRSSWPFGSLKM